MREPPARRLPCWTDLSRGIRSAAASCQQGQVTVASRRIGCEGLGNWRLAASNWKLATDYAGARRKNLGDAFDVGAICHPRHLPRSRVRALATAGFAQRVLCVAGGK